MWHHAESVVPATVMYTEPDAKERLLPKKARGAANEITSLRIALLFDKNETLKERDLLDPADDFALTALCEIQKRVLLCPEQRGRRAVHLLRLILFPSLNGRGILHRKSRQG